jgi:hypothetical protein
MPHYHPRLLPLAATSLVVIVIVSSYHYFFSYYIFYKNGADLRHTPHGSPQTIPIYGRNLRPYGAAPIIGICSFSWW